MSYILTAEKYRINFLGTITNNTVINEEYNINGSTSDVVIKIALEDSVDCGMYAVYLMDNANTNPYQVWKDAGSPDFPDSTLRRKMRNSEVCLERLLCLWMAIKFKLNEIIYLTIWQT